MSDIQKNGDFIKKFFVKHEDHLRDFYPGLTIKRIETELESYIGYTPSTRQEILKDVYLESSTHPLKKFCEKLEMGVPLEYITSKAFFYKSEFFVNSNVLIPRNETEIIVEKSLEYLRKIRSDKKIRFCDVGTGCGAILLSILQEIDQHVEAVGVDVCEKALSVAKRNYYNLFYRMNPKHHVRWVKSDRLSEFVRDEQLFDLIVSNPPYIKKGHAKSRVHDQVLRYEPKRALFLNDDEYEKWFFTFFSQVDQKLSAEGVFIMEGSEDHLKSLLEISQTNFKNKFSSFIEKDYSGRERFLIWQRL